MPVLPVLRVGRPRQASPGVRDEISVSRVSVFSPSPMSLLWEIPGRRSTGVLLKLSLGDPLDRTSFLLNLRNSFYLWRDRKPSLRCLCDPQKIFYNGKGFGSLRGVSPGCDSSVEIRRENPPHPFFCGMDGRWVESLLGT